MTKRLQLLLPMLPLVLAARQNSSEWESTIGCTEEKIIFDEFVHKPKYIVGVHAIRGINVTQEEYVKTFADYLSHTAGNRFDPPIEFEIFPLRFDEIFKAIDNDELDFLYANPGVYTCVGTEVGATALVTAIKRNIVRNKVFDLDVYGGVIATRADNTQITHIEDLKDKIIGAGAIIDLMAGQMQIYEMGLRGMSYVNDPRQVVFAKDQTLVVKGLLDGTFDVGFIRTGLLEDMTDESGKPIDPDLFKVIDPKTYVMDNDDLFPFLHSTAIFPEWPLAALTHVPGDVVLEVQDALLKFGKYAKVWEQVEACASISPLEECQALHPVDFSKDAPCDTTWDTAQLAFVAAELGEFAGFRASRSYHQVRNMQQKAGFMLQDTVIPEKWYCTRPSNLYEGITCPEGFFKQSESEFLNGCAQVGLTCDGEDWDCFCKPCVRAYDVDVYQHDDTNDDVHLIDYFGESLPGCAKMSVCATIEQRQSVTLRIFDNEGRENPQVQATSYARLDTTELEVRRLGDTFAYEFTVTDNKMQAHVIDILFDGVPISQSPIRVMVVEASCAPEIYGPKRAADSEGECVCQNNTYQIGSTCLESVFFFLLIFALVFVVVAVGVIIILGYKKQQSDNVWLVNVDELQFNQPIEVVGHGAFGVVVLGHYRGTKVAVKRVLPPKNGTFKRSGDSGSMSGEMNSTASQTKGRSFSQEPTKEKALRFNDGPQDEEKPAEKSTSGLSSSSGGWEDLLGDDHKFDSALRLLESATLQGSSDMVNQSFDGKSAKLTFKDMLPLCMRWDDHSRLRREFISEMRLLSRLRHPCITTIMGAVITPRVDPMLVMEYMEYGSLYDLLRNETMYAGGDIILQIIRDITQGINFLHSSRPPILHGDLKAKNILVDSRFRAKVADFGFSHFKTGVKNTKGKLRGTPVFLAPEYLRRKTEYTTQCDMYSFGMILYEIYARSDPFEGEDLRKILPKICHPRINRRPPVPPACPSRIADVMKKCWSHNAVLRPAAKDVDYILVEMSAKDAEPLENVIEGFKDSLARKPTSLYDVFPKHIADALNAGKRVEPESHEIVTVVFSDIVGFTTISQTFTPMKVSMMLDRLYQAFDTLSKKHSVFKVETIGDAYMGVTNLDGLHFETHVKHAAEYAMDILEAASKILIDEDEPEKGTVMIRVGFHSGPVVANVIGSLNPRYGLFGDTVNTASRMESSSTVGRIHCSLASAELLRVQAPTVPLELRGKIKVKGKGKMITYWVGNPSIPNLNHQVLDAHVDDSEAKDIMASDDAILADLSAIPEPHDEGGDVLNGDVESGTTAETHLSKCLSASQAAAPDEKTENKGDLQARGSP